MKKLFAVLMIAAGIISQGADEAKFSPWDGWRQGYEIFQKGEVLMRAGKLEEALVMYKRSRDLYLKVREARPDWNQNVIDNRLALCEQQINKIEDSLSGKTSTPTPPAAKPVATSSGTASSGIDNDEYKKKYFNLFIEVENLRKQVRSKEASSRNMESIMKEKKALEENYAALIRRYQDLQDKVKTPDKELEEIKKQLLAERLKSENADKSMQFANEDLKKIKLELAQKNQQIKELNSALEKLAAQSETFEGTVTSLNKMLKTGESIRKDMEKNYEKLEERNRQLLSEIKTANAEITKQNKWIDELGKKKGDTEKVADEIVNENRKLKTANADLQKKIDKISVNLKQMTDNNQTLTKNIKNLSDTLASFDGDKKSLESELKLVREGYIKELNAGKLMKAENDGFKTENKKLTDSLKIWIEKHNTLTEQLDAKGESEALAYKKLEELRNNLQSKENQKKINMDSITLDIKSLESRNKELLEQNSQFKAELAKLKLTPPGAPGADYQKLKVQYDELKEKYDFLATEIDSLNKPLAEVGEIKTDGTKTISSTEELALFLTNAAKEAIKDGDFNSAAWYYGELIKQDEKNSDYKLYGALYSYCANDYENALSSAAKLNDSKEKFLILAMASCGKNDFKTAEKLFIQAGLIPAKNSEVNALCIKELQKQLPELLNKSQAKSAINAAKKLI